MTIFDPETAVHLDEYFYTEELNAVKNATLAIRNAVAQTVANGFFENYQTSLDEAHKNMSFASPVMLMIIEDANDEAFKTRTRRAETRLVREKREI